MTIEFIPILLPPSADSSKLSGFGKEVKGFDPGRPWTEDEFREIEEGLYKVRLCFPGSLDRIELLWGGV